MALIDCKYCGKQVSNKAQKCPHCGRDFVVEERPLVEKQNSIYCEECNFEIMNGALVCPRCGCPVSVHQEKNPIVGIEKLVSERKIRSKIVFIAVALCMFVGSFLIVNNMLIGDDKIAYDLVLDVVDNFKEPSSVRIVSGTVGVDGDCIFCGISAQNAFGTRLTGYYYINEDGQIMEDEDPYLLHTTKDELNIDKINKKLSKTLGYSN